MGKKGKREIEGVSQEEIRAAQAKHTLLLAKDAGVIRQVKYAEWVNPEPEAKSRDWIRDDLYTRFIAIDPHGLRSRLSGERQYWTLKSFLTKLPDYAGSYGFGTSWPISIGFIGTVERLEPVLQAIREASSIPELPANWDGQGALPVSRETWEKATALLMAYATYIADHYDRSLLAPQIDALPDGSVDLFWKEPKAQLLINVPPGATVAGYYGDTYSEDDKIKGKLPVEGVKEYLAVWMKNLSS